MFLGHVVGLDARLRRPYRQRLLLFPCRSLPYSRTIGDCGRHERQQIIEGDHEFTGGRKSKQVTVAAHCPPGHTPTLASLSLGTRDRGSGGGYRNRYGAIGRVSGDPRPVHAGRLLAAPMAQKLFSLSLSFIHSHRTIHPFM